MSAFGNMPLSCEHMLDGASLGPKSSIKLKRELLFELLKDLLCVQAACAFHWWQKLVPHARVYAAKQPSRGGPLGLAAPIVQIVNKAASQGQLVLSLCLGWPKGDCHSAGKLLRQ